MRIIVLTSSRADFGIYLPLLKKIKSDKFFNLNIVAFGTHLSRKYGYTLNQIIENGFKVYKTFKTVPVNDKPVDIAQSIAYTLKVFSNFWKKEFAKTDLIICLGDRYEMFAAVSASIPFNITVAHIHGGETTLGAIDNKFRNAITAVSNIHFTSTKKSAQRVIAISGSKKNIYNVGALSLDNLRDIKLMGNKIFKEKYGVDLNFPTILFTFHPETVAPEKNLKYIRELELLFKDLINEYQILVTLSNTDTSNKIIRKFILNMSSSHKRIISIESLGTLGYFSCLKNCSFIMGNSSSGIIEAASFGKYVINLGNRQNGRERSKNVIDSPVEYGKMKKAIIAINADLKWKGKNVYDGRDSASAIIKKLKCTII